MEIIDGGGDEGGSGAILPGCIRHGRSRAGRERISVASDVIGERVSVFNLGAIAFSIPGFSEVAALIVLRVCLQAAVQRFLMVVISPP